MGSLQYEFEWNHGREKELELELELELDEEQAPGLQSLQFATAQAGDQGAVDTVHGRHPVSQEPRGVHAEEAGGCYPERGQLHQVLASM
jgi:hypothetical protein